MLLLIDNYDSFTFNVAQYLGELGHMPEVVRNDAKTADELLALKPGAIVISPGPGTPDDAGVSMELIKKAAEQNIPVLGICLGHQAIGQVFGSKVVRAPSPMHGKTSKVTHKDTDVFKGLPSPFEVVRYHSLVIEKDTISDELEVTAETEDGIIMGVAHKTHKVFGIQFHPESIATAGGKEMLRNFVELL